MRFHATIQSNGKTATGISVPAEVVAGLGSSAVYPSADGTGPHESACLRSAEPHGAGEGARSRAADAAEADVAVIARANTLVSGFRSETTFIFRVFIDPVAGTYC